MRCDDGEAGARLRYPMSRQRQPNTDGQFFRLQNRIHAIPGINMGAAFEACVQYRSLLRIPAPAALVNSFMLHRDLPEMQRRHENHCLHRSPGGD